MVSQKYIESQMNSLNKKINLHLISDNIKPKYLCSLMSKRYHYRVELNSVTKKQKISYKKNNKKKIITDKYTKKRRIFLF